MHVIFYGYTIVIFPYIQVEFYHTADSTVEIPGQYWYERLKLRKESRPEYGP